MRTIAVLLFAALFAPAAARAQGNPNDFQRKGPARERDMYYAQVRTEINELLILWRNAWERDDANKLAAFYMDDATYFPAHGPQAHSRAAIQSYFAGFLRNVGTLNISIAGFGMSGDLAYVTCRVGYHLFDGSTEHTIARTDLILLRRQRDHRWLIEAHMAQVEPEAKPLP
jgi:uncharacterized protein (TIGR02246 family)